MPSSILQKLPKKAREMWDTTYEAALKHAGDEKMASRIAWAATKKRFKKVENKWVARDSDFETYTTVAYTFNPEEATISRSDDGHTYVNYVLGTTKSIGGVSFSQVALKRMAEQINVEKLKGRIDQNKRHALYQSLINRGLSPDEIEEELQRMESGIEAVNASVINNKLVAKLKIHNSVYPQVSAFKGASIEARYPSESLRLGVTDQARLMGFVFTDDPADEDAIETSQALV